MSWYWHKGFEAAYANVCVSSFILKTNYTTMEGKVLKGGESAIYVYDFENRVDIRKYKRWHACYGLEIWFGRTIGKHVRICYN